MSVSDAVIEPAVLEQPCGLQEAGWRKAVIRAAGCSALTLRLPARFGNRRTPA